MLCLYERNYQLRRYLKYHRVYVTCVTCVITDFPTGELFRRHYIQSDLNINMVGLEKHSGIININMIYRSVFLGSVPDKEHQNKKSGYGRYVSVFIIRNNIKTSRTPDLS